MERSGDGRGSRSGVEVGLRASISPGSHLKTCQIQFVAGGGEEDGGVAEENSE